MAICKVHGCWDDAEGMFAPSPEFPALKIPLCSEHQTAAVNGEPWLMDANPGGPGGGEGPAEPGYTVRMGADMPVVVQSLALNRTMSHAPGSKMVIRYETPDGPATFECWVDEDRGKILGEFFGPDGPKG